MGLVPTEEEKRAAKTYQPYVELAQDLSKQIQTIKELVAKHPNDQELGREIRKLINNAQN